MCRSLGLTMLTKSECQSPVIWLSCEECGYTTCVCMVILSRHGDNSHEYQAGPSLRPADDRWDISQARQYFRWITGWRLTFCGDGESIRLAHNICQINCGTAPSPQIPAERYAFLFAWLYVSQARNKRTPHTLHESCSRDSVPFLTKHYELCLRVCVLATRIIQERRNCSLRCIIVDWCLLAKLQATTIIGLSFVIDTRTWCVINSREPYPRNLTWSMLVRRAGWCSPPPVCHTSYSHLKTHTHLLPLVLPRGKSRSRCNTAWVGKHTHLRPCHHITNWQSSIECAVLTDLWSESIAQKNMSTFCSSNKILQASCWCGWKYNNQHFGSRRLWSMPCNSGLSITTKTRLPSMQHAENDRCVSRGTAICGWWLHRCIWIAACSVRRWRTDLTPRRPAN